MDTRSIGSRAVAVLLLVAIASASLAPTALADHGRTRTKRGRPARHAVVRVVHRGPQFIHRHSEPGALAGFLGGLVVGSVLSNARPAPPPPPAYEYYDPYCQRYFVSVGVYDEHLCYQRHPRSV